MVFHWVFVELKIHIRADGVRVELERVVENTTNSRHKRLAPIIGAERLIYLRVEAEFRGVVLDLVEFNLRIIRVHRRLDGVLPAPPRPYIKMHFAAEGSYLERPKRPERSEPSALQGRRLTGRDIEDCEGKFHSAG